ncbi:MAG: lysylphosphatidylglycerol synthase transmembrane domain-containing protein [Pseudomonadota bacterium]
MKALAKAAISLSVLGALVWWADAREIFAQLRSAKITWLLAALAALTAATFAMARRWQVTARAFGIEIGFWHALGEYYISQLVNGVLPGGVLGDVGRAVRVRQEASLAGAAQSVMAERLIGQIFMCLVLALGLTCALLVPGGLAWPTTPLVLGLAVLVAASGIAIVLSRRAHATGRFLQRVLVLARRPEVSFNALVSAMLLIFAFYAACRAINAVLPPSAWFTLIPLVLCAMLVPLSIGGWGWREGAAAALFPLVGAASSTGIAASMAYGALLMVAALPAGYFILHWHGLASGNRSEKLDVT